MAKFQDDIDYLAKYYAKLFKRHGDHPRAADQKTVETQEQRIKILCEIADDIKYSKVLDFGCGLGPVLTFMEKELDFRGEYIGYDIVPEMIEYAKQKFVESDFYDFKFECRDILKEEIPEKFDYILINGVFNNKLSSENNWKLMTILLEKLFKHCRKGIAFSMMSIHVDWESPQLYYVDPSLVFTYCRYHFSSRVVLRHDYIIGAKTRSTEFTMYVYRNENEK